MKGSCLSGWTTAILAWTVLPEMQCFGAEPPVFNPFAGPKPLVVIVETNPWLQTSRDRPMVVLYEDGQLIYEKWTGNWGEFRFKHLTGKELKRVRSKLRRMGDFQDIEPYYDLGHGAQDLSTTWIYLDLGDGVRVTSIYGLAAGYCGTPRTSFWHFFLRESWRPEHLPQSLFSLQQYFTKLDFRDAVLWDPPYLEVMAREAEVVDEPGTPWPQGWPGLDSPQALPWTEGGGSIFLSGHEKAALPDFLDRLGTSRLVEIDGKNYAVSSRRTFPSQLVWSQAFRNMP